MRYEIYEKNEINVREKRLAARTAALLLWLSAVLAVCWDLIGNLEGLVYNSSRILYNTHLRLKTRCAIKQVLFHYCIKWNHN